LSRTVRSIRRFWGQIDLFGGVAGGIDVGQVVGDRVDLGGVSGEAATGDGQSKVAQMVPSTRRPPRELV
jgi:hypothetical protein